MVNDVTLIFFYLDRLHHFPAGTLPLSQAWVAIDPAAWKGMQNKLGVANLATFLDLATFSSKRT